MTKKRHTIRTSSALIARVLRGLSGNEDDFRSAAAAVLRADLGGVQVIEQGSAPKSFEKWRTRTNNLLEQCISREVDGMFDFGGADIKVVASFTSRAPAVMLLGPYETMVQVQLLRLIREVGVDTLRRCDCGQLFVKAWRREYCSYRCQKRVYMRIQRAADKADKADKARRLRGQTTRKR